MDSLFLPFRGGFPPLSPPQLGRVRAAVRVGANHEENPQVNLSVGVSPYLLSLLVLRSLLDGQDSLRWKID